MTKSPEQNHIPSTNHLTHAREERRKIIVKLSVADLAKSVTTNDSEKRAIDRFLR